MTTFAGSEFQTVDVATQKARLAKTVGVRGTASLGAWLSVFLFWYSPDFHRCYLSIYSVCYKHVTLYKMVNRPICCQDYLKGKGTEAVYRCDHSKPEKPPECRHARFLLFKFKYSASKKLSPYGEIAYNYAVMCLDENSVRQREYRG